MNEDTMEIEFQNVDDFEPLSINTNVTIAAYCTSWARLKLWSVMLKLHNRVLSRRKLVLVIPVFGRSASKIRFDY